ncbi:thiamine pyrophosphate-dependent enzyme [Caldilinea sp.]|uniref:alpha-ketoacid dehydrogenase subunit alpha/beta n=1 Tax=Caldilinea sp. TaxID=2293560 RepID=UPI0021DD93CA|nr:thiamine pyrophosphate-dependent enzyme [Caldilinea sp.]GIV68266.1 MAG: transketolase [Caldilinea sp.]
MKQFKLSAPISEAIHSQPRSPSALAGEASISSTQALTDYRIAYLSRQLSLRGRREVHTGRAKFGAFGDGKEVAQVALAHAFEPGDWRCGYYRDQTLMFALGLLTPEAYFAQLYAHTDVEADPASGGRSMLGHYATRLLDDQGRFQPQTDRFNAAADISPTAGQMPRLVGLAHASVLYQEVEALRALTHFSRQGREIAFGIIGNASCAEGLFWEAVNAIGVLRAPAVISIWDDGYGISVPNELQVMGGDLSALLEGFRRRSDNGPGYDLYTVPGWDYPKLLEVYRRAARNAREHRIPALVHVTEMTQPQGHSTSGSHERYKSPERLAWEAEHDPVLRMRAWLLETGIASNAMLEELEAAARAEADAACERAWEAYTAPRRAAAAELVALLDAAAEGGASSVDLRRLAANLREQEAPLHRQMQEAAQQALILLRSSRSPVRNQIEAWKRRHAAEQRSNYARHLHLEGPTSTLNVPIVPPEYAADAPEVRGFEVLQANFDALLANDPRILIFGEDVGRLGDVNQGVAGLQEKYGPLRVADTGIREATIVGQAIGYALRGLRPIAEIQYLDYIYYAWATLADDLATMHWRTAGGQKAPVIIRTRGHRLEGIWHSGSPMGALLGSLRGIYICVPRNMTQAAGFYNTLLRGEDPAIVIEVLNGYRLRERMPANPGRFTLPLGVPEVLRPGKDVTLVTYGACCRIALDAAARLADLDVDVEVIDVRTLLPFDLEARIAASLRKTARLVILDEDVPGGASAFILQQVLETQGGYWLLDSEPRTVTAQPHRPAYGSDGDYFSKPNVEDVVEAVYALMHEADPQRYPMW